MGLRTAAIMVDKVSFRLENLRFDSSGEIPHGSSAENEPW